MVVFCYHGCMNDIVHSKTKEGAALWITVAVIAIAGATFLFFKWNETKAAFEESSQKYEETLQKKEEENRVLSEALYSEQQKNEELEDEIDDISDTVDELEKLSKTDKELLQKYSKVYFLNEHYSPATTKEIPKEYRYPEDEVEKIHSKVLPFLESLLKAADKAKLDIRVISGFRSFSEQSTLKSGYTVIYGAGSANQFSADQGYSEHQLGTTVDFSTAARGGVLDGFQTTPEYAWLLNNAYKYGFVLSYPQNNAYYEFEPWHWRFVGVDLAKDLRREKVGFYDMDQRDIDDYLISIFDR